LTDALGNQLPAGSITFNARIQAIIPGPTWNVIWQEEATTHTQSFDAIVLALPAYALATLRIGALGERPLAALEAIEHPPISSVFLGYRRDQVAHSLDGFGVLIPTAEKRAALGVLFSSSLFPNRAPRDCVALTVMIGGARQPHLATLPIDEIMNHVSPDLTQLLGIHGKPLILRQSFWPKAIPQYNLGYDQYLAAIALTERNHPGLFIGGQARDGISVPACVRSGESLADRCVV
jgi:oxygen-dependent protoporphyrinogen oxidase